MSKYGKIDIRRVCLGLVLTALGVWRLWWLTQQPAPSPEEPKQAVVEISLLLLSIGLSLLASQLLKPDVDTPVKSDTPTTLSLRGSYIPWFVGIRRVGPVFASAFEEQIRKEKVSGGKGGGSAPEQDVFYEGGWHLLAVGPCDCLHSILESGKTIFSGPITRDSHPSGTTVTIDRRQSFTIYWGEADQPVNSFLGDSERVGISSRWPHVCYVVWNKKRKGTQEQWPILDYVLERRPIDHSAILPASTSWHGPVRTLDGPTRSIFGFVANSDPDTGYLELEQDRTSEFKPKDQIALSGNGLPDGDYIIRRSEAVLAVVGTIGGFPIEAARTRIYLQTGTAGADDNGTMQAYTNDASAGANIAHMIAELLFASWPLGLGLDSSGLEPWDVGSLEELALESDTDGWRGSIVSNDGEKANALLGTLLQDTGTMLRINNNTGALEFQRVREPSGTLPDLGNEIYASEKPEIETQHGELPVDNLIFVFKDREHKFGDMTIAIDEDGQADYLEHQHSRKVPIGSTTHFDTAAKLAELRSPEELAGGAEFRISAAREARLLMPGDPFIADGFDEVLRVASIEIDDQDEQVRLSVVPDFYGARKTDFENNPGGGFPEIVLPEPDPSAAWVEVPEQLLTSEEMILLTPSIRANSGIVSKAVHLSRDNVTYNLWGSDTVYQTGGTLQSELSADGPTFLSQGPQYDEQGPDNGSLTQDLSSDLTNWGLGRQLAVIVSTAGTEICFLQRATVVSAGVRRLDGLIRARYDTRKVTHPAGSPVFIFDRDAITPISDALLEPAQDLYTKTQPSTTGGTVDLSTIPSFGRVLAGKGLVPIKPDYLWIRAPYTNVAAYQSGDDVTVSWAISSQTSPNTGLGFQGFGDAIGSPTIPGTLILELLTTGDVLKDTRTFDPNSITEQTWTNAELVAALGSEVNFKFRLTHQANGFNSQTTELTVSKV